ncbi:hypothetical protein PGTUg99_023298 [Puccinia graminis f. sp. tritici]|uniref:Uncharacterized protein n=1 Tax=Puccinia graminis f. sp. tritici TaxID=56615 RepID=A0A5B0QM69_PUCGR|nr:hypothetical protein PGTUg99_023298 [Puccinia graminis f. sp. tritici]
MSSVLTRYGGSDREAHSVLEDDKCTIRKKAEVGYLEASRFGKVVHGDESTTGQDVNAGFKPFKDNTTSTVQGRSIQIDPQPNWALGHNREALRTAWVELAMASAPTDKGVTRAITSWKQWIIHSNAHLQADNGQERLSYIPTIGLQMYQTGRAQKNLTAQSSFNQALRVKHVIVNKAHKE